MAILAEMLVMAVIVYVPVLQEPFGLFSLAPADWTIAVMLAPSGSPVLELTKWLERRGWFDGDEFGGSIAAAS